MSQNFVVGEKILCFHGLLIYEAKIHQVEVQNGICKYFLHYHGWNKNWDEWVPEARMMKHNDRNLQIQADLERSHKLKQKQKKGANKRKPTDDIEGNASSASSTSTAVAAADHVFRVPKVPKTPDPVPVVARRKAGLRPQKRNVASSADSDPVPTTSTQNNNKKDNAGGGKKNGIPVPAPGAKPPPDNTVETEDHYKSKLEIKIKIPDELKAYLVDDWEQICKQKRLCVIPAKVTAEQLIQDYVKAKTSHKSETAAKNNRDAAIAEVTTGIKEYFNVTLPSQLLFKQERQQYEDLKKESGPNGVVPLKMYGAVHLLRLFVRLGEMLIYTPLSERSVNLLLVYIHDFLMYIKKNASIIFSLSDYYSPEENL